MSDPTTILVRATVNLDGVRAGQLVRIDPDDPYFVELMDATLLVPIAEPAAAEESES